MKILLQRVSEASVTVENEVIGAIDAGIMALVAIEEGDDRQAIEKGITKLLKYRIFSDDAGKMNLSLLDIQGELLLVSQFTLAAETNKGLRPSFSKAAKPEVSEALFQYAVDFAKTQLPIVATGKFRADMKVALINDGPVTFLLEM